MAIAIYDEHCNGKSNAHYHPPFPLAAAIMALTSQRIVAVLNRFEVIRGGNYRVSSHCYAADSEDSCSSFISNMD